MTELLEALHTTPSRRYLSPTPIDDDVIRALLDAAIRGPSGGNSQRWAWIVVRDATTKSKIADLYRDSWTKTYASRKDQILAAGDGMSAATYRAADHLATHLEEAPVWIFPVLLGAAKSTNPRLGSSIYGAVQHLILAARAYGIGATLTTLHTAHEPEVRRLLNLPDTAMTMALIPLGYPAKGRWSQPRRRPLDEVIFHEQFH
ncbi:nitroreductase [Actinoplanes sp. TBRC 11911]|uniref:nitroreductase family protein n=1 Tax=Actinoplanes sp. TBRC 11911 TaxID=2729386 RepID=UPI00145C3A65|nr:nitroreductase family protein [Actinoplanes sp. TBRC 11911]NMO51738.1 nitroreductase [Actinoplanes sp. TBRC 11911]